MLRHAATSRKALSLYCFVLLGTSANFLLRRRLPGNVAQIRRLCEKFESTDNMNFEEIPNPLTVAGFLKKVLLVSPMAFDTRSRLKLLPTRHTHNQSNLFLSMEQERKVDLLSKDTQQLLERAFKENPGLDDQVSSVRHAVQGADTTESDLIQGIAKLMTEVRLFLERTRN